MAYRTDNLLQRSRYELKYLVSERLADQVREFARQYLAPDPYARISAQGLPVYAIYSVYLDNVRQDLLNATVWGHKNRFKLRVRYYDEDLENPVYFEIKRRVNGAILKERAKVRRDAAHRLLTGGIPHRDELQNPHAADQYASLRRFVELQEKLNAKPTVIVAYDREAWLTPDGNSARLTFDRSVAGGPYNKAFTVQAGSDWVMPEVGGTVLELKFTDRYPNWMRDMVQLFGLERCSMAKYVKCAHMLARRDAVVAARPFPAAVAPAQSPATSPLPAPAAERKSLLIPPGFAAVPRFA